MDTVKSKLDGPSILITFPLSRLNMYNRTVDPATLIRLNEHLADCTTDTRIHKTDDILRNRTRYLCLVLENIHQSQNASATVRTAEAVGIQDVHFIEDKNSLKLNKAVVAGSTKWTTIFRYNKQTDNTQNCLNRLKQNGYRIVATTPHNDHHFNLDTLPLDQPLSIVFGCEKEGVSDSVFSEADYFLTLPMYGFTESYNISVSVGIMLYTLMQRLKQSDFPWLLSDEEQLELKHEWLKRHVVGSTQIIRRVLTSTS